jgi:hypothetical protein
VTIHDFERGLPVLREQLVPRVKQAPGFVKAYWLRSRDNHGMSVVVFETEETAEALAGRSRQKALPQTR